ncbi:hypothetical protein A1Q2_03745 [Trichosporon asahii var. asahii CBS 8904]|uniref:BZIP domain-containing protein n=1 Tax=Trichosporon asahii var. asahii (strain CBS 8904) TaxID=1220162 RepID=K1VDI6_TRIAC|nr:hypothetical protein A1Q2_03745 [Trichosporon asahii var. asahii CBS 8904]
MTNAVASSSSTSKRPAGAAPAGSPAAKRANTAKKPETDEASTPAPEGEHDDNNGEAKQPEEEMDEEARAKAARREARTIRNRESAQRSRNQRKAHLAWLEARVVELEAENRALRTGSAPSSPAKTRESSPANSVLSLASDLGIPPEIVTAGGGVNLATVAPPPAHVLEDIKPSIDPTAPPAMPEFPTPDLAAQSAPLPGHEQDVRAENAHLRWRVGMLENIVKQAATFFSSYNQLAGQPAPVAPNGLVGTPISSPAPGMDATLSPPLFPAHPREAVKSPLRLQTQLVNAAHHNVLPTPSSSDSSFIDLSNPVARHPAVMATSPAVSSKRRGQALQRATGSLTGINWDLPANRQRLDVVAKGTSGQVQNGTQQAQDGWFPEGTQATQWDEEMNDLLETLESSRPEGVAPVVPGGGAVGVAPVTGEEWAWEATMVEL